MKEIRARCFLEDSIPDINEAIMENNITGKLIVFEGIDGSGKSTAMNYFAQLLEEKKVKYISVRDPGGFTSSTNTPFSPSELPAQIRKMLLNPPLPLQPKTEFFLFLAARVELAEKIIIPHLKEGYTVLCDRYFHSSIAYQIVGNYITLTSLGYASDRNLALVKYGMDLMQSLFHTPDVTVICDTNFDIAQQRIAHRGAVCSIEKRGEEYFKRVSLSYSLMQKNYKNIVTIENNDTEKELYHRVKKLFDSENAYDELKACTTIHHEGMCREVLDLRGRKMAKIDKGMFTRLGSLEKILLADSHIEEIEEGAFGGLGKLRVLDLSSNRLKKLKKGMFRGLSRLEYLNLNNNNIEEIEEGAFEGLGELRELNVDCNHINRIKKGCFEGANLLTVLYARNNKLNAIEEGAFEGLVRLSIVNLKSNPLRSAEILQQIKKELLLKEINPAHKNQGYVIIVTDPDPSKSTPLIEHGNCPLMWLETSFWAR